MHKILFVCHGNICRSPMAEFLMKQLVAKHGLQDQFLIESAAVSDEEHGNPVYPPAVRILREHGISCSGKTARQVRSDDYGHFDFILCAEERNIIGLRKRFPHDPDNKIRRMLDFSPRPRDIDDPWYSGDFHQAFQDISEACDTLFHFLLQGRC